MAAIPETPNETFGQESTNWSGAESLAERVAILQSRAGCSTLDLGLNRQGISERAKRWRAQIPFANGDLFAQRLAAAHMSETEFQRAVDDEGDFSRAARPSWLRTLIEAYSASNLSAFRLSDLTSGSGHPLRPFLASVEPIIDHFATRLREGAIELANEYDTVPFL